MFPGGSVWPYRLEKRTCLFVYGVRAAEAHFPAWNTLSGLLWLWLGIRSSLQGQSSFMGLLFPVKIYPGDRSSRNFQCLSNQLWQRESLGIGFCIPPPPPGQLVKPSRRDKHLGGGGCRCLRDCSGLHSQLQPEFHSETLEKKKWVAMWSRGVFI